MSVPILTIPESAFSAAARLPALRARRSQLLVYMLSLTRASALALVAAYLVGFLAARPLMASAVDQRIEFLEACRARLRGLYLAVIGKVDHIPIIGIERAAGQTRRIYADSVCQTEDLARAQQAAGARAGLGLAAVLAQLRLLGDRLGGCRGYLALETELCRAIGFSLKDLRLRAELVHFDANKLFVEPGPVVSRKPRHMAREVKQGIRTIKGMFMSGRA
ncbi:hypothetical protein METBIDRAFT_11961 [Metschnikowia bicuspidata var. bicuspidata NRRL YB-4993]|uniref:Uncharacterized protein n=1 Tax=Metschnikowia bicuspidata var. bicuspidata NRRL YB-4993 TaxID=869754 RepID=A0A1A0HC32_9ASCO|nr:hypothetical protein METBIDRAFT_11961 [Metschnikowia bicuspidata var. bicuspidata NRRL YB-4993]OBA21448.1 hypothetical protein METBIDRAFT_11961 [Metschnikowia bicuspidata var. bicuspidata NRRL YB-4993]